MRNMNRFLILVIFSVLLIYIGAVIVRFDSKIYCDFAIVVDGVADSGSVLRNFTSKTRRECVLECVSLSTCNSLNFQNGAGSCELIGRMFSQSTPLLTSRTGWVYMTTNEADPNMGPTCKRLSPCKNGGICGETQEAPGYKCTCDSRHTGKRCEEDKAFTSCKAVYEAGFRADGIYMLQDMGYHYCALSTLSGCSTGGWTLIVKTDGHSTAFDYHSSYWTSNNVHNQIYALKQGLDGQEGKFDAFNKLSFTRVCIGLKYGSETRFLEFPRAESSMLSLMQSGTYKATSAGRSSWLGLLQGSYMQPYCNREGFNNQIGGNKFVRIGIFGNNENDCSTIDSVIGIGIGGSYNQETDVKTGDHSSFQVNLKLKARGFILIQ